ncbi:MAG: nuclear transport factor 2 family protein [Steroidobacteraceae bacterium]|jgi:ketosteroid isomerase-like protein
MQTTPRHRNPLILATAMLTLGACTGGGGTRSTVVAEQVRTTELAFAKTMADRDFSGFASHLSSEAIFFGQNSVKHGSAEVSEAWKPFFREATAPFAWAPDHIEVLRSGTLALSTGPVTVGGAVVGRFNSIWRLEAPNTWRIVFDKGEPVCASAP